MWHKWGVDECIQDVCGKAKRKETTRETETLEKMGGMDRIDVVYDRNQWETLVNTLMSLYVP
jgi:hypothetical protein